MRLVLRENEMMEIGIKIKEMRLKKQLTQEELADRCELTKGYISQIENDLTSPSIATLKDILQVLGSSLSDFFSEDEEEPVVFHKEDYFEKESEGSVITWLVPTSQKNEMEPIMLRLKEGAATEKDLPHDGEEFGFVLRGRIMLVVGKKEYSAVEGESFYYRANKTHYIVNTAESESVVLWLSCPPNF